MGFILFTQVPNTMRWHNADEVGEEEEKYADKVCVQAWIQQSMEKGGKKEKPSKIKDVIEISNGNSLGQKKCTYTTKQPTVLHAFKPFIEHKSI